MATPIINPSIPFVGQIDKFTPQESVKIQGTIAQLSYGFNINLQCGPKGSPQQDDIALQISVRYFNGYISLNSFRHATWDKDLCISPMPIKSDEKFEIVILCELHQYKVIINGVSQYDFPQRIAYDKISHLRIEGDVNIAQISYELVPKDSVALEIAELSNTANVQTLESQPAPVVTPQRKRSSYRTVFLVIATIGVIVSTFRIIRLINLMNSNSQNNNQAYNTDFRDGTNN